MKRLIWYMWQLLPLTYWSNYRDIEGAGYFSIWRMWLGRAYRISTVQV